MQQETSLHPSTNELWSLRFVSGVNVTGPGFAELHDVFCRSEVSRSCWDVERKSTVASGYI